MIQFIVKMEKQQEYCLFWPNRKMKYGIIFLTRKEKEEES